MRHQPALFFSQNKSATSNQPTVLFSQNKPAPAVSHQENEQFLSEQIGHQQPANSTFLSEQTSTSRQPPGERTGCKPTLV
jgi:hypothetical protein